MQGFYPTHAPASFCLKLLSLKSHIINTGAAKLLISTYTHYSVSGWNYKHAR